MKILHLASFRLDFCMLTNGFCQNIHFYPIDFLRKLRDNILAPNSLKKYLIGIKMYILTEPIGLHAKIKSK